jgi:hypothetical protein
MAFPSGVGHSGGKLVLAIAARRDREIEAPRSEPAEL